MSWWLIAAGLAGAVGMVLALWPLHANGVNGNAIKPRYGSSGFASYRLLPADPTLADLRAVGVRLPQDVVKERRRYASTAVAVGLIALTTAPILRLRASA